MKKITRRDFLALISKSAAVAAFAQLLSACGIRPVEIPPTPSSTPFKPLPPILDLSSIGKAVGPTDAAAPSATPEPTPSATGTPTAAPQAAYLAVARGGDDPEALVRAAIGALGGMAKFVPSGANVLIKPNVCTSNHSYLDAATTNPWTVGALVKMCFEAGAGRVLVFDFPFNGYTPQNYTVSGIAEQVLAAGGELETLEAGKFCKAALPSGRSLRTAAFYGEVIDADVVINVPIAKHHSGAGLTLGMKNLMGVVQDRGAIHNDLQARIADLADFVRPELTVIDAVRILTSGGPIGSRANVRVLNTVIASADIVAADAYAASRIFNAYYAVYSDPNRLGYVRIGAENGLGRSDLENLAIEEISVG
ncbi:MAG: DUF362 domain-containing protein [Anaerolineales bacterium]|nr:DUF362 domain-containing protein [Anaerolineales bacterium]